MHKEVDNLLLSIIVPVYNAENTLYTCLVSILNQDTSDCQIVIINDGSTDSSQKIIEDFASKFQNVRHYCLPENQGIGKTRNLGIKHSSGKYITFVDADDYVSQNYIECIKSNIIDMDLDMLVLSYHRTYTRKKYIYEKFYKFSSWDLFNQKISPSLYPEMIYKLEVASWLRVIKRSILENNEQLCFSDRNSAEDLEASLKWYLKIQNVLVTDEKLYHYVIRPNSLNFNKNQVLDFEKILKNVCDFYIQNDEFTRYFAELEYIFTQHLLISNLLRLMINKDEGNQFKFDLLRNSLLQYFPNYKNNIYLKKAPINIRFVIYLTYKYPRLFKVILKIAI